MAKEIVITYRDLRKVPNEVILAVYNGVMPAGTSLSALDLEDEDVKKVFLEILTPYTQDFISLKKRELAREKEEKYNKFRNSLTEEDDVADELHNEEQRLYGEYCQQVRRLEKIVNFSVNFYSNLDNLYQNGAMKDHGNNKPFVVHKNGFNSKYMVVKGNLILISGVQNSNESGILYTEYEQKEFMDKIIAELYEEKNNETQEENE